jgi:hypothetical protein
MTVVASSMVSMLAKIMVAVIANGLHHVSVRRQAHLLHGRGTVRGQPSIACISHLVCSTCLVPMYSIVTQNHTFFKGSLGSSYTRSLWLI